MQIKCQLVLEDAYENEFRDMFDLSDSNISECRKTQKMKMKTSKQEAITKDKELMQKLSIEKEAREKSEYEKVGKKEVIWPCMYMRT